MNFSSSLALHAFVWLLFAGDLVTFELTATNTGNLRLRNIQLMVPLLLNATISCTTGGATARLPAAAVLEPGSVLHCNASHTVSTPDIEGGPQLLTASTAASSVLGELAPVVRTLQLQPQVQAVMTVTIQEAGCVKPTKAGTTDGMLTCPIQISNTGNVGLLNINLQSPATACTAPVLEPGSPPLSCQVSLPSTLADFEAGSMRLNVLVGALPRFTGAAASITAETSLNVSLVKSYSLAVEGAATPPSVTSGGMAWTPGSYT